MKNIYLYLKIHNETGLKYLGKTNSKNPYKYKGSGLYWKNHIQKHGYNVTTIILFISTNIEKIQKIGLFYSSFWNIVESKEFANLEPENGIGGVSEHTETTKQKIQKARKKQIITRKHKNNISKGLKKFNEGKIHFNLGRKQTPEEIQMRKIINSGENNPMFGKTHSEKTKNKMKGKRGPQKILTCPHCGLTGGASRLKSCHFEKCKKKLQ